MPADDPLATAEIALRDLAMTYPGATEEFPWDHRAIKVKGKIFLVLAGESTGGEAGTLAVTVKIPDSNAYALLQPYAERTGYGLGKSGWVTCRLRAGGELPMDLLEEWVEESYRAVAPKKLVLALNARQSGDPEPAVVTSRPAAKASGKATAKKPAARAKTGTTSKKGKAKKK